jgi:hypothetical protein
MPTKLKTRTFAELSRTDQAASILYPNQVETELRDEMTAIAKANNRKGPTQQTVFTHSSRGAVSPLGGVASSGVEKKGTK